MVGGEVNRFARSAQRLWLPAVVFVAVFVASFFLAFGFATRWGAQQWGSYGQCVAAGLTFAAVVVALRESFKSDRARRVDHEVARRRECIDVLADLWTGISKMALVVPEFTAFLRGLPSEFDLDEPLQDHVFGMASNQSAAATDIQEKWLEYMHRWNTEIGSQVFKAFSVISGTPLDEPLMDLKNSLNAITSDIGEAFLFASSEGRRPDLGNTIEQWGHITAREGHFISLARQHFSFDLKDIEEHSRRD